jgi:hypothetical protein
MSSLFLRLTIIHLDETALVGEGNVPSRCAEPMASCCIILQAAVLRSHMTHVSELEAKLLERSS